MQPHRPAALDRHRRPRRRSTPASRSPSAAPTTPTSTSAGTSSPAPAPSCSSSGPGDVVRTRPMKGTAPRGRTTAEDREQCRLLRASSKEQAENLMIVDLLRNDLGRVAEVGSVVVDELFALERYPTVWQMTSQVSARVPAGHRAAGPVPRALPLRFGHRRAQAAHDAADPGPRADARAASTAAPSDWSLPRPPRSGPGSTSPSGPPWSTAPPARPCTGPAAASPGVRRRRRNGRSCTPRRPSWPTT